MTSIPYTVERRPDTGVNNVQLGVWLFLASEVMLFGGLFSAYFMLRAGATEAWEPMGDHLAMALLNTVLLLSVGLSIAAAGQAVRRRAGDARRVARAVKWNWLLGAQGAAVTFCVLKFSEYAHLLDAMQLPSTSTQLATYYLLTGVHVLHVIGGIVANAWLMIVSDVSTDASSAMALNRLRATALYWFFVDAVWLLILVLVYVV